MDERRGGPHPTAKIRGSGRQLQGAVAYASSPARCVDSGRRAGLGSKLGADCGAEARNGWFGQAWQRSTALVLRCYGVRPRQNACSYRARNARRRRCRHRRPNLRRDPNQARRILLHGWADLGRQRQRMHGRGASSVCHFGVGPSRSVCTPLVLGLAQCGRRRLLACARRTRQRVLARWSRMRGDRVRMSGRRVAQPRWHGGLRCARRILASTRGRQRVAHAGHARLRRCAAVLLG